MREARLVIGIDAANLRRGGGVTHLVELIAAATPEKEGIARVVVWGGQKTLAKLPDRPWLDRVNPAALDRRLLWRVGWQRFRLSRDARQAGCHVLLVPGGSYAGDFRPVVTISQNLLPFEWRELRRFGWSPTAVKLLLLRHAQTRSFRHSDGVIFLTEYAREAVQKVTGRLRGETAIIPHGLNPRFSVTPRLQRPLGDYSEASPFRLLYVSIIDQYKHQWKVAEAVHILREEGWPVCLELVGPAYPPALRRLLAVRSGLDPSERWLHYRGAVPYEELDQIYRRADLGIFASSCENMPIILLETMAAGLPVVCSSRGPMPEVLGEGGLYCDPEDPVAIADAIRTFIQSPVLRREKSVASFARSQQYSWESCADHTFAFLAGVARRHAASAGRVRTSELS